MVLEYHVNVYWYEVYQAWPENSPAHVMVTPDKLHIKRHAHGIPFEASLTHTDRAKVGLKLLFFLQYVIGVSFFHLSIEITILRLYGVMKNISLV